MCACVLVVDDNADILDLVERVLSGCGYDVLTFQSPLKALEEVQDGYIDLAILDIAMPEMDGLTLANGIRKIGIPFLFMSAFEDQEYREKSKKSGALELLLKPVRNKQLIFTVENALAGLRGNADKNLQDPRVQRIINMAVGIRSRGKALTMRQAYHSIRDDARSAGRKLLDVASDIVDGQDIYAKLMQGDTQMRRP